MEGKACLTLVVSPRTGGDDDEHIEDEEDEYRLPGPEIQGEVTHKGVEDVIIHLEVGVFIASLLEVLGRIVRVDDAFE